MNGPAISKKKRIDYVADFETTTDPNDCRVWAWGFVPIDTPYYGNVVVGHDIKSFIDAIFRNNSNVYFHNLKFDGMFLLDYLLREGFNYTTDQFSLSFGEFSTLISDHGQFYSITVRWRNGKSTQFRDSLKKLPMKVSRIATSFRLEESKGEIDYEKVRPVGYRMTPEEEDYLRRDVTIVAQALRQEFSQGMTKLTVASDSMSEFKRVFTPKRFAAVFPVLSTDMDLLIRRAYRGGFSYADPRFTKNITRSGLVFDVNSLYPSVMFNDFLPYGIPFYNDGFVHQTENRPLTIFQVTFTAKLKPNHIPCIQIKGNNQFAPTEYLRELKDPTTLTVTNVDWELWNDHYDIDVLSYDGGFAFQGAYGFFDDYINKWMDIKINSDGGLKEIAKLHLNGLYGKFATNPNVTGKVPSLEKNMVKLRRGPDEQRAPVYTAMGAFITAYARSKTIRAAQANYDTFAYADTDSLHLLRDDAPPELDVHPSRLGAWKLEYHFQDALYIRPKAYMERKQDHACGNPKCNGRYENHIAGLPLAAVEQLTYDQIRSGAKFGGKLAPRTVPGGVVLENVDFTLTF